MKVLFVCTGNLCRSPMAEGFLRTRLASSGVSDVEVASAGTWGVDGEAPTRLARAVLADRGIDISQQKAASVTEDDLATADIVIAMTSVHRNEMAERWGAVAAKVILLKELHEMSARGNTPQERAASLASAPRPGYRRALDVDDPMGLPYGVYERCAETIDAGVARLVDLIWS